MPQGTFARPPLSSGGSSRHGTENVLNKSRVWSNNLEIPFGKEALEIDLDTLLLRIVVTLTDFFALILQLSVIKK